MTLSLSPDQRVDLAERLDLDPWTMSYETIAERFSEMQRRVGRRAERSFADVADPTGILRLDTLDSRPRALGGRDDAGDVAIDSAVARGAVRSEDRAAWRRKYEQNPDLIREILDGLPGDPSSAERAYAEDRRLRSLGDQLDDLMGVPQEDRVREFSDPDDGLPRDPTGGLLRLRA